MSSAKPHPHRAHRSLRGLRRLRRVRRIRRAARVVLDVVLLAATMAAAYALWPASLGGASRIIVVEGHSMEPTHHLGDLLFVRTDAMPDVGDVMVFHIPADEPGAGSLVVHRVIGRHEDGTLMTQGDNRTTPDPFRIGPDDVVGSPVLAVPHGGRLIGLASRPTSVAVVSGLLAMMLLWPAARRDDHDADETRVNPDNAEEHAKIDA